MRARYLLIILALIPIALAFPEDLPWKYPARWRLIYEINTQPLTDEYNVWVTITVPEQYYTGLITWMQNHVFCPQDNSWDPKQFWPHPWYVSDYDPTYIHFVWDYSVHEFYEYNITTTCQISLPKTFSVLIRSLQGGVNFKNYNHYIVLYFPAIHASTWWAGLGQDPPSGGYTPGIFTSPQSEAFWTPIDLDDQDWLLVFLRRNASYAAYIDVYYDTDQRYGIFMGYPSYRKWINAIPVFTRGTYALPSSIYQIRLRGPPGTIDFIVLYPKLIQELYGT